MADSVFGDVKEGKEFVTDTGEKIKNMEELISKIKSDDAFFKKHVDEEKNDFAFWIEECVNSDIGSDLGIIKDKDDFLKSLDKKISKAKKEKKMFKEEITDGEFIKTEELNKKLVPEENETLEEDKVPDAERFSDVIEKMGEEIKEGLSKSGKKKKK